METLASALIGHMVGDYLMQNDWMALNKKKHSWPCFVHCLLWTLSVFNFTQWGLIPCAFLFVTHFIQDRTYIVKWCMEHAGQSGFTQPPFAPWSLIVVDNTWHLVQIWFAWKYLI